ncbi:MAG TPA: flagellar export chaperone FliS [Candidatus Binatia bacterium]|nr:flagellar export chaperone FliS [Candidatus Binatia bacterium]
MREDTAKLYREAAVRGASPVGLVVLLYEEALRDLRRALAAVARRDIEERTLSLSHALQVIGYLQSVLNFERGGRVAVQISAFYDFSRSRLLEANLQNSSEILEHLLHEFTETAEAWRQVGHELEAMAVPAPEHEPASGWAG